MTDHPSAQPNERTTLSPGGDAVLGGRRVARIGYGAMQLEHVDPDRAVAVLRRARELGVEHVDTAEFYGGGASNRLIRTALAPYDGLTLATKVGATHRDGVLAPAQRPSEIRAEVEANLATLGAERLDVVNLRRLDDPPGLVAEGEHVVPLDDQLAELGALRDAGKIGAIGLSNVDAAQVTAALPARIACVQNRDNLIDAGSEPVHAVCRGHGIAWVPFFPLGSGFPGQAKVTDDPVVRRTAGRLGATPAQLGLAWLLAQDERTLLIPGTSSLAHLEENLGAGRVRLDQRALDDLEAVAG